MYKGPFNNENNEKNSLNALGIGSPDKNFIQDDLESLHSSLHSLSPPISFPCYDQAEGKDTNKNGNKSPFNNENNEKNSLNALGIGSPDKNFIQDDLESLHSSLLSPLISFDVDSKADGSSIDEKNSLGTAFHASRRSNDTYSYGTIDSERDSDEDTSEVDKDIEINTDEDTESAIAIGLDDIMIQFQSTQKSYNRSRKSKKSFEKVLNFSEIESGAKVIIAECENIKNCLKKSAKSIGKVEEHVQIGYATCQMAIDNFGNIISNIYRSNLGVQPSLQLLRLLQSKEDIVERYEFVQIPINLRTQIETLNNRLSQNNDRYIKELCGERNTALKNMYWGGMQYFIREADFKIEDYIADIESLIAIAREVNPNFYDHFDYFHEMSIGGDILQNLDKFSLETQKTSLKNEKSAASNYIRDYNNLMAENKRLKRTLEQLQVQKYIFQLRKCFKRN